MEKNFEKVSPSVENAVEKWFSKEGTVEKHELNEREQESKKKLEQDLEQWRQQYNAQADDDADDEYDQEQEENTQAKIKKFLIIAETKGLMKSINIVKKTNDPYLIDLYHDILCKDDLYLKFK